MTVAPFLTSRASHFLLGSVRLAFELQNTENAGVLDNDVAIMLVISRLLKKAGQGGRHGATPMSVCHFDTQPIEKIAYHEVFVNIQIVTLISCYSNIFSGFHRLFPTES